MRALIALTGGSLLAWLIRELWAPLLSPGYSFEEHNIPVQTLMMVMVSGLFALFLWGLIRVNEKLDEHTLIKPRGFLAFLGGLTGALVFYLIYGSGTLNTGRVDWLFTLGDNAQHYLGWVFYRNDPWMFPIGFSCSLGYPTGTCMCFMDSIPLLAIPLKVFSFLLPATFQYFGLWTLLSFTLQGILASLLLYEVSGSRLAALVAPMFFCTADILLFRVFRYTPLSGQWIILFALYLYFINRRGERQDHLWPAVHIMAVLIQGYFFVMTFVVFCGALLERYLKERRILPALRDLAVSLAATALVMWITGFFTASVDMSDAGLGYFKANLNAFFNPLTGWSRFFSPLPLAENTYAMNVNYLGAGIILLFLAGLAGLIFRKKKINRDVIARNAGLLVIIPVLGIFALSNVITFNEHILFTYTLPDPILKLWGVFRGTERMLWPIYYLVFIFAIGQIPRLSRRPLVTAAILLAALTVQVAEVYPQLQRFHAEFSDPQGKRTPLRSQFWEDAAGQFKTLVILPLSLDNWAPLTRYAAENRLNINYSYYARQSPLLVPAARQKMADLADGKSQPGEMYIIKSPDLLRQVCARYGQKETLVYVNGEWVLAPGLIFPEAGYKDAAITGRIANCAGLSLPEFLTRYADEMVLMAGEEDVSFLRADGVLTLRTSPEVQIEWPDQPGSSFIGILTGNRMAVYRQGPQKLDFTLLKGVAREGISSPVDIQMVSAGRISGEEDAVITINGRDYSYHRSGLNLVVIDPATGEVLDTALFTPPVE